MTTFLVFFGGYHILKGKNIMLKDCQFCINTISVISFSTKKSMDNKSQANYVNIIDLIFQLFTKTTTNETMDTVMFPHLRDIQTLS